jgi:hypothetical protein
VNDLNVLLISSNDYRYVILLVGVKPYKIESCRLLKLGN